MKAFTETTLPNLSEVVLAALELFSATELPELPLSVFKKPLVVGSGNAEVVGQLLFSNQPAVFANESTYIRTLENSPDIDGVVLVSSSGGKHAVSIAEELQKREVPFILLTNNEKAPALKSITKEESLYVFPKNREPYTYNTSTYMGMLLARTEENSTTVHEYITEKIAQMIPATFNQYEAFCLIVPARYSDMCAMFTTKFDELFGPKVIGRVFTSEEIKHAKTVVPSDKEFFLSFGEENVQFGVEENRLYIPLPDNADCATMMAVGYYVIGAIQSQFPPYFKENIVAYTRQATELFGSEINVIVE